MSNGNLREALALSELVLADLEMSTASLSTIALKVSRLARLMGNFETQKIMSYESSGYPTTPNGVSREVWELAKKAGRVYQIKHKEEVTERASVESIEQLEIELVSLKDSLASAQDPNVSVTSANPNQFVSAPIGNGLERRRLLDSISEKSKLLAGRRSYIYNYVVGVHYELKFSQVADDIFDRIRVRVDQKIGEIVPDSIKKFSAVYENLLSDNDEDWSNAVHSCRRILQDTADALFPAREDKVVEMPGGKSKTIKLGADNYINRLIAYVEENSHSTRFNEIVGSHMKYLGERLDAIFQAAQKGSHDVIASQDEADRYVVFTYLVVGDILQLKAQAEQEKAEPEHSA